MSSVHCVSGAKLFEWINKFYPFIHEMKCIDIKDGKFIYQITADLFSCPYHTLVRDRDDSLKPEKNKIIPIGKYFRCYNDNYVYALKETNADMI